MSVVIHNIQKTAPKNTFVDGEQFLIKCSGCDEPLVFVWANQPSLDIDFKVSAECCYCDDKSFPIDVHGGFSVRGYDRELDCPQNVRPIVNIVNMDYEGSNVTIQTEKA